MDAEVDKGKMPGGSTYLFGLPRRTTGGFSFVLDQLAKSLAEVRVFSKWLAENGALNDCFPPFFI